MNLKEFEFGSTSDDRKVFGFEVSNSQGISLKVINYGATLISMKTPDKTGVREEITLGFSSMSDYEHHSPYFGSTIGRVANRIRDGVFKCEGVNYQLAKNEKNRSHLHGGLTGFDKVIWDLKADTRNDKISLTCEYNSPDGEEGYPGHLQTTVTYILDESNCLTINYVAETDRTCPVNLTNHTYWNLTGSVRGSILNHELKLNCDHFLPVDDQLIPTGILKSVTGTPWDFRQPRRIGEDIEAVGGYDHCFVISMERGSCIPVATLFDPVSGREMKISTTEPGIQFYSGNFLENLKEKGFNKHDGLCLETQLFPDAVNQESFPSILLKVGETYTHKTVHKFGVRG